MLHVNTTLKAQEFHKTVQAKLMLCSLQMQSFL